MTKSILTWKMITEPVQMRICVGEQKTVPLQLSLVGQQKWFAEPFEISLRESTKQYIYRALEICLLGQQKGLQTHLK